MKIDILVYAIKFRDCFSVRDRQFQRTWLVVRGSWNATLHPFASIQHEARSVNALALPSFGILVLPRGPLFRRKRIAPAEPVPVIDMKRKRHEILPKSRLALELGKPG